MRNKTVGLIAMLPMLALAAPSENTFDAVTNDWYNACFSNVYELAQIRLASNANDVVGAYLMVDFDIYYSDMATISSSVARVIASSDLVKEPAFADLHQILRPDLVIYKDEVVGGCSEEARKAGQPKSRRPHRSPPSEYLLKILWDCGLW